MATSPSPQCLLHLLLLLLLLSLHLLYSAGAGATPPPPSGAQSDIDALLAFRQALHDPTAALSTWDPSSSSAPCSWRGVVCSNASRVLKLSLPRLRLSGRLSDHLSNLPLLLKINLRSNSFSGPLPSSLPPQLRYLDLSSNAFTGSIPSNLSAAAPGLQYLNLSSNRLRGTIPPSLGLLTSLQHLVLDWNLLEGTIPAAIGNCSSLIHLSLQGNKLRGIIPDSIPAISSLQTLCLSRLHHGPTVDLQSLPPWRERERRNRSKLVGSSRRTARHDPRMPSFPCRLHLLLLRVPLMARRRLLSSHLFLSASPSLPHLLAL